ncbi:PREDICTED: odorant receptor 49b-like [Dinoponera quadriceps]|uniref:Odorant receptor n=1 Tax=Dinoponera quadriceps TaxID=609295 RepID=A0A6P3XGP6_DINQU|nr:PREDICTED: odorant receptor 49b-like [Dinoponera quadriceps]
MANPLTMGKLIVFLKVDLLFACCWPLRSTATRCAKIRNKIFRLLSVLHGMTMVVAIVYTIYVNRTNMFLIMKLCCELCTTTEVPLQVICYSLQYDRLQYVIYELEDYCKRAKPEEREVFHRYIYSCKSVYVGSVCAFTVTGLLLIISPLVEPHPFPVDIEYPFYVDYQPVKTIIYLHHILLLYQSYTQVCSNIFVALLLWFVSARCDILSDRFRAVTKFEELHACVTEHQELLNMNDVNTRIMLSRSRQPMSVKSTFLIFFISSLAKVYLCAWPADHLLSASTNIAHAAYESMWYNGEANLQKNFLHILLRSQHPIAVNVPCMLPTVSLNYYTSYISTAFSYLATFRVLLENEGN